MVTQQFKELAASASDIQDVTRVLKERKVLLHSSPDLVRRTTELVLEADVLVAVFICELRAGTRDAGFGTRISGFRTWELDCGICRRKLLDFALEAVRGLLDDAQRRPEFFLLCGERPHGGVVPSFPCEERLEVPFDFVARVPVPVDRASHPVDRVDARVVRLQTERHVSIDVFNESGVELLLA